MTQIRRRFFLTLIASSSLIGTAARAQADNAQRATSLIQTAGQRMIDIVNNRGLDINAKKARTSALLRDVVDLPGIARFVLGRHWRSATPAQQQAFSQVFEQVIVQNLASRFGELEGVTFQIARTLPRDDTDFEVQTLVGRPGQQPTVLGWRVGPDANQVLKVTDVVAEGTSLRLTTRSEYSAVLQRSNGNLDELTERLRVQLAQNAPAR